MNSKRTQNILISCGIILLVACLIIGVLAVVAFGLIFNKPISLTGEFDATNEITPIASPTNPQTITQSPSIDIQEEEKTLSPDLAEALLQIESEVMRIRELRSTNQVEKTLISEEALQNIVVNDFFSEYSDEEAQQDVLALSILGLIPEAYDLKALYNALYSEQIAGFYDNETEEIYVVQAAEFGGNEKLTYAHEFTHVLQDQVYDFQEGLVYTDEACEEDSERCAAIQSLIEGDASLTEILWFQKYASRRDYLDLLETYENLESPVLDSAPAFLAADLLFPYEKGLIFVQSLYDGGGFAAVDDAYLNLPISTEQILHPERYPDDRPQVVTIPDLKAVLGDKWLVLDQNVMGEWYTYLILNKAYDENFRIPEKTALEAAEGWGGDAYVFYLNEKTGETIFVLNSIWDTLEDAQEFEEAFSQYADLRWEKSQDSIQDLPTWESSENQIVFVRNGSQTLWVFAPSQTLVEAILSELR